MPAILYPPNSYCNMLPPYLTAFTVQSYLKMPFATFPVHTKHKVCTAFKGQEPNSIQDTPHVSHTSTSILSSQTCRHLISVDVLSHKRSKWNSVITNLDFILHLWRCLMVYAPLMKCFRSQALCTEWPKIPSSAESDGCCTVLKLGKCHKPNSSVGIRDFIQALRTSTHPAISWVSAMLLLLIGGD